MSGVAVAVGLGPPSDSLGLFASAGAAAARDQAIKRNAKRTPTGRAARPQVCHSPDRLWLCNTFPITPLIGVEEKCSNLFAVAPTLQTMLPVRSFNTAPAEFQTTRFPRISRHRSQSIRTRMSSRISAAVKGRPGFRCLLESYFWAINRRCQTRRVSGVTMLAKRSRPFRPTFLPLTAHECPHLFHPISRG